MTVGWNDADEVVVFGNGQAYKAPVGTTLPAKGSSPTAALNSAFEGLGYWTQDEGVKFAIAPDIAETRAAQAAQAIRRELTALDVRVEFTLLQWNESTVPTALGGSISVVGGIATYTPPTIGAAVPELSMVVDVEDGSKNYRWVFPRGNSVDPVESTFLRSAAGTIPVAFSALTPSSGGDPFYFMTDDPAFATGS